MIPWNRIIAQTRNCVFSFTYLGFWKKFIRDLQAIIFWNVLFDAFDLDLFLYCWFMFWFIFFENTA